MPLFFMDLAIESGKWLIFSGWGAVLPAGGLAKQVVVPAPRRENTKNVFTAINFIAKYYSLNPVLAKS